jgi:S1-C subfamily serine protease
MPENRFYVRVRGKVLGPFTVRELESLRDRGQFRRFHEVSEDRRSWSAASTLSEVFPPGGKDKGTFHVLTTDTETQPDDGSEVTNARKPESPSIESAVGWFYIDSQEKQQGPVSAERLISLHNSRVITPTTAVWKPGMAEWAELSSVEALRTSLGPGLVTREDHASHSTSGLAVLAFMLALLWLGGLGSMLAIVFGLLAIRRIGQSQGTLRGKGLATGGVVLGIVLLAATPVAVAVAFRWFPFWGPSVPQLSVSATPQQITEEYRQRVYAIRAGSSLGSGILVASKNKRGLIVTNVHVVAPELEANPELKRILAAKIPKLDVLVKNPTQLSYAPARIAALHRSLDAALVISEVDSGKSIALTVARQKRLKQGESAVALGNPQGLEFFTSSGIISSTSGEEGYIWTTCPISGGSSGGPLFLSRHGLLAGINTLSVVGRAQNLNGSIPAEEIVSSLRSRQTDNWIWSHDLRELAYELSELIRMEE